MFTGIIETSGKVVKVDYRKKNKSFVIQAPELAGKLEVDQSLSHNGVCLTVEEVFPDGYRVTAIKETLDKSNLDLLKVGDEVNLERSVRANSLLDGHIVQGHVDKVIDCISIKDVKGSWVLRFRFPSDDAHLMVEKGSICLNGISLTISALLKDSFEVSIIPYTWENTNLNQLSIGDSVNVEYDIIGKYIARNLTKK